jgi:hypothetical protein
MKMRISDFAPVRQAESNVITDHTWSHKPEYIKVISAEESNQEEHVMWTRASLSRDVGGPDSACLYSFDKNTERKLWRLKGESNL